MSAVNVDGNLASLCEYERQQDALEAYGAYIDTQVDYMMEQDDIVIDALLDVFKDDTESRDYILADILSDKKDKYGQKKSQVAISKLEDVVREHLAQQVREQDE